MSLLEKIQKRESCRNFSEREIERNKIEACIEAARLAPSACNSQPWKYLVVSKKEYLPVIAKALQVDGFNRFSEQCPMFVLVLEQPAILLNGRTGTKMEDQQFAQIDIGLSVMQFCLEAQEQGLGSCIMGSFDAPALCELLSLPFQTAIRLVIGIGYPRCEKTRNKVRKSVDQIVSYID